MTSRVYIDSSIFLGWLLGNPKANQKTQEFLNKINQGLYDGVTSTLVLNELIKVIRKNSVEHNILDAIKWDATERKAIQAIFAIKGLSVIKGEPNDAKNYIGQMTFGRISSEALVLMKKYPGKVGTNYKTGKKEHDGISPVDAYHIILAKRCDCDLLATLDNDFMETRSEITPLVI